MCAVIVTIYSVRSGCYYSHLRDEETEAQRGGAACSRLHNEEAAGQRFEPTCDSGRACLRGVVRLLHGKGEGVLMRERKRERERERCSWSGSHTILFLLYGAS